MQPRKKRGPVDPSGLRSGFDLKGRPAREDNMICLASIRFGLLLTAVSLVACGGGPETPTTPSDVRESPQAVSPTLDATALLDWAEKAYSSYFPGHQVNQTFAPYTYRYYPQTQNYLGVDGDSVVVLGPISGGQILPVGRLSQFGCAVKPLECLSPMRPMLSAASTVTVAIDSSGRTLAWGDEIAAPGPTDGPILPGSLARQVATTSRFVSAGSKGVMTVSLSGVASGWGTNAIGWLGGRLTTADFKVTSPRSMPWPGAVVATAFGDESTAVSLMADGTVWYLPGTVTRLDTSGATKEVAARQVPGLGGIVALSHGEGMAHAMHHDGSIWVVIGSPGQSRPYEAKRLDGVAGLRHLTCVGYQNCIGVTFDGRALTWGDYAYGGLNPVPTVKPLAAPTWVSGPVDVKQVAVTDRTWLALSGDGRVWSWGDALMNGRGDGISSLTPALVPGIADVTDLACSRKHCVIRRADGSVWSWGNTKNASFGGKHEPLPVRLAGIELK